MERWVGLGGHERRLYEAVPCGIIVRNAAGRIVFVNSAARRMLRASPDLSAPVMWMPTLGRSREDGTPLLDSEAPGAIASLTGEPVHDFAMRITRLDGTECWLLVDAVPLKDADGAVIEVVTSLTDISERKRLEAELAHRASHDQLTGLPNRWLFLDRIGQSLALARREDRAGPALLFADLDGFKVLNDRYGHAAGDAMLREVALRFRSALRDSDTVARIGGDEFGVLLPLVDDDEEVSDVERRLCCSLEPPWSHAGTQIRLGASVGHAIAPSDGTEGDALFAAADARMYEMKRARPVRDPAVAPIAGSIAQSGRAIAP